MGLYEVVFRFRATAEEAHRIAEDTLNAMQVERSVDIDELKLYEVVAGNARQSNYRGYVDEGRDGATFHPTRAGNTP